MACNWISSQVVNVFLVGPLFPLALSYGPGSIPDYSVEGKMAGE